MSSQLIKLHDFANTRNVDLVADIDKNGEVANIYDYNGNELKINFLRYEVYFQRTWWHFDKKQPVQK